LGNSLDELLRELLTEEPEAVAKLVIESIDSEAIKVAKDVRESLNCLSLIRDTLRSREDPPCLKELPRLSRGDLCVVAIDTSYTAPPIDLIGGKLGLILLSVIKFGSCGTEVVEHSAKATLVNSDDELKLISKIAEREFIRKALISKKEGTLDFDMIVIDGELFPRVRPGGSRLSNDMYERLVELTDEVLKLGNETNTTLVGVLKRVYGKDLKILLKIPELKLVDKSVASYILSNGEFIHLGDYYRIQTALNEYIKEFKDRDEDIRSLRERLRWISRTASKSPMTLALHVLIYKPLIRTYFSVPVKAEVLPTNEYTIEEITSYLSLITSPNGVPYPIDVVDRLSRVRRDLVFIAQQMLYSKLIELLRDERLALSIAGLTNPEKMYVAGFKGTT